MSVMDQIIIKKKTLVNCGIKNFLLFPREYFIDLDEKNLVHLGN